MLRCESVPNDGPTVIGGSSLEEFTVTGESLPVVKGVVALVFAEKITVFNEQGIAAHGRQLLYTITGVEGLLKTSKLL